jgi:uncharacterized protein (TIGR00251 family)
MQASSCLQPVTGGVRLRVKVQPRASRSEVVGVVGDELKIRIAAPPVDSAANDALVEFLAEQLDRPRREVLLVRGHKSSHKVLVLVGIPVAEAVRRLLPAS